LPHTSCHAEISNGCVVGLAGTMGHDGIVVFFGHLNAAQGLGHRANLIQLDEDGICNALTNSSVENLRVGDKDVIADQLNLVAEPFREFLPPRPVVFRKAIFKRKDLRVVLGPVDPEVDHLCRTLPSSARLVKNIGAVFIELAGCRVQIDSNVRSEFVARLLHCKIQKLHCLFTRTEPGSEATLVADAGFVSFPVQQSLRSLGRPSRRRLWNRKQCWTMHASTTKRDLGGSWKKPARTIWMSRPTWRWDIPENKSSIAQKST